LRGQPQSERLSPGEEILISEDAAGWAKQRVDTAAATSWSLGRHVFRDRPLGDAVDEVNRYATKKVVLADRTLTELSISCSFVSGDSESVVAAFAAVLPIRIADSGNELLLFRRRTD
jgi:transmembrane sensor